MTTETKPTETSARNAYAPTLYDQNTLEGQLLSFLLAGQVESFAPDTIKSYGKIIGYFVKYCDEVMGVTDPKQLTANHVRMYLLDIKSRCKPGSLLTIHGYVRRLCTWLVDEGVIDKNPMATIKAPRIPRVLIKTLSHDDIKKMLALCDENRFLGLRNKAIILLFLDTAIRLRELASLMIDDIDFDHGLIKIMGKGAKERVVAIQEKTQTILLRYLLSRNDKYPNLWVTEERVPLYRQGIAVMISNLGKMAGIKDVRCSPHTLRHTSATMMFNAGAVNLKSRLFWDTAPLL